jgi:mannose-1-phosphate guanylyltransferase
MKAFLLAAGMGKRLRPLTNDRPKCMIPVAGKPLLHYWLYLCKRYNIKELLINLCHHPSLVEDYLSKLDPDSLHIEIFHEDQLLGSGGTVAANADFIEGERDFYILYADNLTNVNLESLLDFHRSHDGLVTMGLFRTPVPEQCGIVELDARGQVISFQEKPAHPRSNLANAGVLVATPDLLSYIPEGRDIDLGHHVLPRLVGRMHGYVIEEYLQDIGTMEKYLDALKQWRGFAESTASALAGHSWEGRGR